MSNQIIRVLIADDHEILRKSIQAMLLREPDINVIATAGDGREAVQLAESLKPDVIVMDISMPGLDGIRAAGEILARGIPSRVVMLSMHYSRALLQQSRKNGALAYILKQQVTSELVPAIRAAHAEASSS